MYNNELIIKGADICDSREKKYLNSQSFSKVVTKDAYYKFFQLYWYTRPF